MQPKTEKFIDLNDGVYIIKDKEGTIFYYKNGELHRDNDQPAVTCVDGSKEWWVNGKLHRDNDQPAVIYSNGTKTWYVNGKRIKEHYA